MWKLACLVVAVAAGCSSSSGACASTDDTGPCTGTFVCANDGISITCDTATQVCVVGAASVMCEDVAIGSGACPSEADAASVAGCSMPFVANCSGSTSEGISVTCKD